MNNHGMSTFHVPTRLTILAEARRLEREAEDVGAEMAAEFAKTAAERLLPRDWYTENHDEVADCNRMMALARSGIAKRRREIAEHEREVRELTALGVVDIEKFTSCDWTFVRETVRRRNELLSSFPQWWRHQATAEEMATIARRLLPYRTRR